MNKLPCSFWLSRAVVFNFFHVVDPTDTSQGSWIRQQNLYIQQLLYMHILFLCLQSFESGDEYFTK